MAQALDVPLDVSELADQLGVDERMIRLELGEISSLGHIFGGLEEGLPPILPTAGRQFLARRSAVRHDVLRFLPRIIDDLNTREALLVAGTILVDEFRAAWLDGDAVGHAREMVPHAFAAAIDERGALDLYAAAVALMARLSDGAAAGCVAEAVIAVSLIEEARTWLELHVDEGALGADEQEAASEELRGLFELFEDDDVLEMFEMQSPPTRRWRDTARSTDNLAWSTNAWRHGSTVLLGGSDGLPAGTVRQRRMNRPGSRLRNGCGIMRPADAE